MQYRYLGSTGLQVSQVSLGSYLTFGHSVDVELAKKLIGIAYDANINLFDNAEVYAVGQSEEIMGTALSELNLPRDSYLLMTKVFWGGPKPTQTGLHRKHIFDCCHASLKRLKAEYIDILLCHRPDPNTPIEETVRSMHQLIQQGKILYWGTSEWSPTEITEAILVAKQLNLTPPSAEQFEYNMLQREKGEKTLLPFLQKSIGAVITMPMAGGILTGKYNKQLPLNSRFGKYTTGINTIMSQEEWEIVRKKLEKLGYIADALGLSMAQLAIAWCLKNQYLSSVIVGASTEQQLLENLKSTNFLDTLTPQIMNNIDDVLTNKPNLIKIVDDYELMCKEKYV